MVRSATGVDEPAIGPEIVLNWREIDIILAQGNVHDLGLDHVPIGAGTIYFFVMLFNQIRSNTDNGRCMLLTKILYLRKT